MGFFTRLFGNKGVVRFEATTISGEHLTGKCPIETIGLTKEEIEEKLKGIIYVENGIRIKTLKIIGFYET